MISCATIGHINRPATHEISYNYRGDPEVTRELVCAGCAESYGRRPVHVNFAAVELPKLTYRTITDREREIRAGKTPIGTVRLQGSLRSCQAWYGRGNWDGAEDYRGRTRAHAGLAVWSQWYHREQAA